MKKFSDVFKSIRFAKLDPQHEKSHKGGSQDDEEHYTVGEKEWDQQVKHAKKRAMQEEKKDKYDEGEYDREGDMAKSDLRSIMANAKRLHDMIEDADNLPEWCQNKITIAEDYISTVANYLTAEMNESVADTLAQIHSELRKKSGLPHPDYYKELGKAYDIKDDQERMAKQSEIKKKYKVESYVPSPHSKPVPKKPKDEYERKVEKYLKKKYNKEEVEQLEEKNVPTNPSLWSRAKSLARSKFDVYPSAYANGWASKWYKSKGGGWKSVSEEIVNESRKTDIIKKLAKKKPSSNDKFEPNPVMMKTQDDRDH